ncbi:hypothetical protein DTL42_09390 [Bremerella cremea]|uniref:Uncharacterized protein n=1 Tax=Bremerella cremea TaxID=1031537 RepID=A0A368KTR1_9BACT|nr:zinc ribbon domain-containing protein [Bremerella cremea]RCS53016.1 hypothetical protein DTL42_09390 [Bremerella cremea]
MKLIPLNCRQCGAPLSVPEDVRHVTCLHCGTQLAVVREGAAAYTEILQQLDRRTSVVEEKVGHLDQRQQLFELDQEWARQREAFYVHAKDGSSRLPSKKDARMTGATAGVGLVILCGVTLLSGLPSEGIVVVIPFILLFGAIGGVVSMRQYAKARDYEFAKRRYQRRRAKLTKGDWPIMTK